MKTFLVYDYEWFPSLPSYGLMSQCSTLYVPPPCQLQPPFDEVSYSITVTPFFFCRLPLVVFMYVIFIGVMLYAF